MPGTHQSAHVNLDSYIANEVMVTLRKLAVDPQYNGAFLAYFQLPPESQLPPVITMLRSVRDVERQGTPRVIALHQTAETFVKQFSGLSDLSSVHLLTGTIVGICFVHMEAR